MNIRVEWQVQYPPAYYWQREYWQPCQESFYETYKHGEGFRFRKRTVSYGEWEEE